jgi:hypothetical protein
MGHPSGWPFSFHLASERAKRLTAPYRWGPSRDWLKVKNPDSSAMIRAREADWS